MRTAVVFDPASGAERTISRLGLGCSKVGSLGNPASGAELRALMHQAFDLGVTVFDTADIYGQGDSEREIGRALRDRRDQVFVITKFGKQFSPAMRLIRPLKPLIKPLLAMRGARGGSAVTAQREGVMREDFSPAWLRSAVEASLRRLRFDHVDALMLHSPPLAVFGDPGVAELFAALKTAGKVSHFGASCDSYADLEAALAIPGLSVLQLPLDVIEAAAVSGLSTQIAQRRIAVFAREVIRLQPDLDPVTAVARAAARPDVACVIAGTSRLAHLEQLARATD